MNPPLRITPPEGGRHVVLYDGRCVFCIRQVGRLVQMARPGAVDAVDSYSPEAALRFPELTGDGRIESLHLVEPDGRVFRGYAAVLRTLATRPAWRWGWWLYCIPPIGWLCERFYKWMARNRYRFGGEVSCADGACAVPPADEGTSPTRGPGRRVGATPS